MYIFGLNFKKGDVGLAKSQMDTIFKEIPSYSIMSFELGNEVSSRVMSAAAAGRSGSNGDAAGPVPSVHWLVREVNSTLRQQ